MYENDCKNKNSAKSTLVVSNEQDQPKPLSKSIKSKRRLHKHEVNRSNSTTKAPLKNYIIPINKTIYASSSTSENEILELKDLRHRYLMLQCWRNWRFLRNFT
jgi:hypothetical protein